MFDIYVPYREEGKNYKTTISDNAGLWMLVSEFEIGSLKMGYSGFLIPVPDDIIGKNGELVQVQDEMNINNNPKMKTRYLAIGLIDDKYNHFPKPLNIDVKLQKNDISLIEDIIKTKKNYKEMKQLCFNMNYLNNRDTFFKTYEYNVDNFYSMLEEVVNYLKESDHNSVDFCCEERYNSEKDIENIFKYCDNKPVKK